MNQTVCQSVQKGPSKLSSLIRMKCMVKNCDMGCLRFTNGRIAAEDSDQNFNN